MFLPATDFPRPSPPQYMQKALIHSVTVTTTVITHRSPPSFSLQSGVRANVGFITGLQKDQCPVLWGNGARDLQANIVA